MRDVPQERYDEIVEEVMDLIGAPDIFGFLDGHSGNLQALEARLQEVMMSRQSFEVVELSVYLRTSSNRSDHLPTWRPLLNAAIEMGKMRGEPVEDIFYGMMERGSQPLRNTTGMS